MTYININTVSESLRPFFENLPQFFDKKGVTIKSARNEIKVFELYEIPICVKSFKKITLFNRLMYSWFRQSKAVRSFKIANLLINKGIDTPEPLGYVEVKNKWGWLLNSFYISFYQAQSFTLAEPLNNIENPKNKEIIQSFARFMATKVHPNGFWHNDLSAGNILVSKDSQDNYSFSIVDLNRIKVKKHITPSKGIKNLKKLFNKPVPLTIMAEEYALKVRSIPMKFAFSLISNQLLFSGLRKTTKKLLLPFKLKKSSNK